MGGGWLPSKLAVYANEKASSEKRLEMIQREPERRQQGGQAEGRVGFSSTSGTSNITPKSHRAWLWCVLDTPSPLKLVTVVLDIVGNTLLFDGRRNQPRRAAKSRL